MDFDSPDLEVEKEFPGLFASESARKKDDDDCKLKVSLRDPCQPTDQIVSFILSTFQSVTVIMKRQVRKSYCYSVVVKRKKRKKIVDMQH